MPAIKNRPEPGTIPRMGPDIMLPPRYWELLSLLADGLNNVDIASAMDLKPKTVENYINDMFTRLDLNDSEVNPRVSAAKWYWARRKVSANHYIFEVDALPVIIEVRREPGNFSGRMIK